MPELDDKQLLAEFARSGSDPAFADLVGRHVNLVHSAALRFSGNPHHAEEITQAVFIILARKASALRRGVVLSGWLYQTARLTAANFMKGEIRRQCREQEAYMQSTLNESDAARWAEIAPLLEEAMGHLGETDRNAIVLRYFENKTATEVASALKLNESAAHMRVVRGVEKLRRFFAKRGVILTGSTIGGALAANSVKAAPAALSVSSLAAAKGAATAAPLATIVNETVKLMFRIQFKKTALVGGAILLATASAVIALAEVGSGLSASSSAADDLSFESFLQNPPRILNAAWELDVPASSGNLAREIVVTNPDGSTNSATNSWTFTTLNTDAHTEAYRLVYDQDDYLLAQLTDVQSRAGWGGSAGQYNGMRWGVQPAMNEARSWLVSWDTNSNPIEINPGLMEAGIHFTTNQTPPINLEIQGRYAVRRFLCWGMFEMVPGTAVWSKDRTQFTATYDEPGAFKPVVERDAKGAILRTNLVPIHGQMTVKLKYENGLPREADFSVAPGIQSVIEYTYSPDFAGGRLPVEYRYYFDRSRGEEGRSYTVRVKSLELATGPIPVAELDPHTALDRKFFFPKLFTNGVVYREGPDGKLQPEPTLAELSAGKTGRPGTNQ
jgi:RNA polymerase sigma factor (sigma-70 family)